MAVETNNISSHVSSQAQKQTMVMRLTLLFVALFAILACLAEAQLRRSSDLLPQEKRELQSLNFLGSDPSVPLSKCQGDCDNDNQCIGSLICFQKNSGGSGIVPGSAGRDTSNNDFCVDPADVGAPTGSPPTTPTAPAPTPSPTGSRTSLFSYGGSPPTSVLPLGVCEGDCDSDADCRSGLMCLQRGVNAGPVPGCNGVDNEATDYCFDRNYQP